MNDPKKVPYTPDPVGVALGKLACGVLNGTRVTLEEAEVAALWGSLKAMHKAAKASPTWGVSFMDELSKPTPGLAEVAEHLAKEQP